MKNLLLSLLMRPTSILHFSFLVVTLLYCNIKLSAQSLQLDTGFGDQSGFTTVNYGNGPDDCIGLSLQSDGKIVAIGNSFTGNYNRCYLARYLSNGTVDTTFGTNGVVSAIFLGRNNTIYAAATDLQQRIIVAGKIDQGYDNFLLARFLSDGLLDTSFGENGMVHTDFSLSSKELHAIAIAPDGKIAVAGITYNPYQLVVRQYLANGVIDSSFAINGEAVILSDGSIVTSIAFDGSGNLVMAGYSWLDGNSGLLLAKLTPTGVLDSTFQGGGIVVHPKANAVTFDMIIQNDGGIIVVGSAVEENTDFLLAKFLPDGNLDSAFGTGGITLTDFNYGFEAAHALLIQSDGKLLVTGGTTSFSNGYDLALARYFSNGIIDSTFGVNGIIRTNVNYVDMGETMLMLPDGNVVIGGTVSSDNNGLTQDIVLAKYHSDGTLYDAFGMNGIVTTNFGKSYDFTNASVLRDNGTIVLAGGTSSDSSILTCFLPNGTLDSSFGPDGGKLGFSIGLGGFADVEQTIGGGLIVIQDYYGYYDFLLAKVLPEGKLDSTFGVAGIVKTDIDATSDFPNDLKILSNHKIVVVGQASYDWAIAQYLPDGSLDTSFDGDGKKIIAIGPGYDDCLTFDTLTDGRYLLSGFTSNTSNFDFAFVCLHPNGDLDTTFGNSGIAIFNYGGAFDGFSLLRPLPDGKFLAAGVSYNKMIVARFNSNGALDSTFADNGVLFGDFPDWYFYHPASMLLLQDGRILLTGTTGESSLAFALLLPNGDWDTSFGNEGRVLFPFGESVEAAGTHLLADGNLLVTGSIVQNSNRDIFIARLLLNLSVGLIELKKPTTISTFLYPNPVSTYATLEYELPVASEVNVSLFDLTGKQIAVLSNGQRPKGVTQEHFQIPRHLNNGNYWLKIVTTSGTAAVQIGIVK